MEPWGTPILMLSVWEINTLIDYKVVVFLLTFILIF